MDNCMRTSHPEGGTYLNNGEQGNGRTPPGGLSTPTGRVYEGPSPAYVIEDSLTGIQKTGNQSTLGEVLQLKSLEVTPPMGPPKSVRSRSQSRPARECRKSSLKLKSKSKFHRSIRSKGLSRSKTKSTGRSRSRPVRSPIRK
ncbi:hypothetical protein CTI12_AA066920 [Artemisia annua]|uniref:Uncharacterized protein n=1 Tax=Artemisia annua TaxID=35608 RepID=A0A2U1NQA3_ARTAN|nr:hypothetical protein CTI12_AA066920 [Artemisia annua]